MESPEPVVVVARGHPGITGRHVKTLELTAEPEITERASCVVGVAAKLPAELRSLRGQVRLTLAAGGFEAAVTGEVNPRYASAERLVVRRSDVLEPETYLINADAGAADLPRELVAALADPAAAVEVTATEVGTPDPVVVVLAPDAEPPADVAALVAGAELVVDLTPAGAPAPAIELPVRRVHRWPASFEGVRTAVVLGTPASIPLPRRRVMVWPPGADLLLAAGAPAGPVLHAGRLPSAARDLPALAALLATVPAATLSVGDGDLTPILDDLRARLPRHVLLVPDAAVGWGVAAVEVAAGDPLPSLAGLRRAPAVALVRHGDAPAPLAVDPADLARALRSAGVSGRTAAGVLTALGVPRKEAYRLATEP